MTIRDARWSVEALLCMAIAACQAQSPRAEPLPWPDTAEATWIATSIGDSALVPGTRVTVQTSATGVGGYTGCNWYGLRRDSTQTLVEMTARGCRPEIQEQERRFTSLLSRARLFTRQGDTLVLFDSAHAGRMTFVRRIPASSTPEQLIGSAWRLRHSTNHAVRTDSVTLRFSADSISGFAGCRNFAGTYLARRDGLRITYLMMHPQDCARDPLRIAEEHLTTVFSETSNFEIRGDSLLLTTFGGDTLRFGRN